MKYMDKLQIKSNNLLNQLYMVVSFPILVFFFDYNFSSYFSFDICIIVYYYLSFIYYYLSFC